MALEKFRLRKLDPLLMHGGQRREGSCTGSSSVGLFKIQDVGPGENPEKWGTPQQAALVPVGVKPINEEVTG